MAKKRKSQANESDFDAFDTSDSNVSSFDGGFQYFSQDSREEPINGDPWDSLDSQGRNMPRTNQNNGNKLLIISCALLVLIIAGALVLFGLPATEQSTVIAPVLNAEIRLKLTDMENGIEITTAKVSIIEKKGEDETDTVYSQGYYMARIPAGIKDIRISAEGYMQQVINELPITEAVSELTVALIPADTDNGGNLAVNVNAAAATDQEKSYLVTVIDETTGAYCVRCRQSGGFETRLPDGMYTVYISADNCYEETINAIEIINNQTTEFSDIRLIRTSDTDGRLKGRVVNQKTNTGIAGAEVRLYRGVDRADAGSPNATVETDTGGYFETSLTGGIYTAYSTAEGFSENLGRVYGETSEVYEERVIALKPESGKASGKVIDATTGDPVRNATVAVYQGANAADAGTPYLTIELNAAGEFSTVLPNGNYTVYAKANEYMTSAGENWQIGSEYDLTDQILIISPVLTTGTARAVLTWGRNPSDLDSHLICKKAGQTGTVYHVWYHNKIGKVTGRPELQAELDLDDTNSFGPETTTFPVNADYDYSFYVQDYTNRFNYSNTGALPGSGAKVTLTLWNGEIYTYEMPAERGTLWEVFRIQNGQVIPVNRVTTPTGVNADPSNIGK